MKRRKKCAVMIALTVATFLSTTQAQLESLSLGQIATYQEGLPAAIKSNQPASFKSYLTSLKPGPATQLDIANAVRVANDVIANPLPADAYFGYYSVPAMSPVMRLPDAYPADGKFCGEVSAVLAQDQYENASFEVFAFKNVDRVNFKLSALKSANGNTIDTEDVDLKVVKVWYQNGNAWLSYFSDPGLKLVPELLLHDENLIRVDTKEKANYARVQNSQGATREVWISAPKKLNVGFDPYQKGFVDAKTLQPVEFVAGQFKQFVLTVHATEKTKPGLYRGNIQVTAEGQKAVNIPMAVRVLPFLLPLPKTNYDLNKDFLVSLMGAWPMLDPDSKVILPTLINLRQHNILHLGPGVLRDTPAAQAEKQASLIKEAGFLTTPIFGGNFPFVSDQKGSPVSFDGMMRVKRSAERYRKFYQNSFGHTKAFMTYGDEQNAKWMIASRPLWRIINQHGLMSYIAGHSENYFPTSGYILEGRPIATFPGEADKPNLWRQIGNGYTGFYAGQHNGSENPTFVRRQHGLEGYLSNFDMVDNYKFAYGPWNDLSFDLYKPMVLAYPISDGLVDTLAWEGFRAGIDDIRYATKLRQLATEAIDSGDLDRVYAGRKVHQWFAMMDGESVDLNAARLEMIEKIMNLIEMDKNATK